MTCPVWRDGAREKKRERERIHGVIPGQELLPLCETKNFLIEKAQRMGEQKRAGKWREQVKVKRNIETKGEGLDGRVNKSRGRWRG